MPGIEGGADLDRRSQKFRVKAVLDPQLPCVMYPSCDATIASTLHVVTIENSYRGPSPQAVGGSNEAAGVHQVSRWRGTGAGSNQRIFNDTCLEPSHRQATPRGCPAFRPIVGPGGETRAASAGA